MTVRDTAAPGRLFCFGLGYCASRLGVTLARAGWHVAGTHRNLAPDTGGDIAVFSFGGTDGGTDGGTAASDQIATEIAAATHLLSSVPPDDDGDPVLRHFASAIAAAPKLRWAGYLSTTGVYGDHAGRWVDETTKLSPTGVRGRRRVSAESEWRELKGEGGFAINIFRLAGIYGPGRSVLDQLRAGTARRIARPGHVFSRIHVADVVAVLHAAMTRSKAGSIYNICDDMPAPSAELVVYACGLLGVEPPPEIPFDAAELSEMARSFYDDNKRVRNERIKRELGITLQHPDYRSGLAAIAAELAPSSEN